MPAILAGAEQKTCPRRLYLDEPYDLPESFRLYHLYDKGVLMYDGGAASQPVPYMQLMAVIAAAVSEAESAMLERNKPRK